MRGKPLKLYVFASKESIASMLTQEDSNGVECVMCYLSQLLIDAKTWYSDIEKLCLCLYYSFCKLKYYLMPHEVIVFSKNNVFNFFILAYYAQSCG